MAALLVGCTTVPIAGPDSLLTEDQIIDMMKPSKRWVGKTGYLGDAIPISN
jgi:hypothetical protein